MREMTEQKPKLVIVGAGLVGCLAAQYMHQYGLNVTLFEYRNDIRKETKINGQSINLAMSNRGLKALQNAGIDIGRLLQITVPMRGRMIHKDGKGLRQRPMLYDVKYERCIYSVGRNDLIKLLLTEVEKCAKINFEHKILNVDLKQRKLKVLRIADNFEFDEEFDYMIGCDGAYSVIRQAFLRTSLFNYSQTFIDHGYMELRIPSTAFNEEKLSSKYLHIWPRKTFMMIALPNYDQSWTVTLFMPFAIFDSIRESEELIEFFKINFQDVLPLIGKQNLLDTYFASKPQPLISVKCGRLNYGSRCLLLGDAAHALVPFFGQGMNALTDMYSLWWEKIKGVDVLCMLSGNTTDLGFEDCRILYQTLKQFGLEDGFERFSKIRLADSHAVSDLSMANYLEMRNLVTNKIFLVQKEIINFLYVCAPNLWTPLYVCVTFTDIPYAQCVKIDKFQKKISVGLILGLALLLLAAVVYFFST